MDFIILKVNGVDVSGCSHDEAVEALTRASEPIMVQVKHRQSDAQSEVTSDHADTGDMTHKADTATRASQLSQCSREIQTEPEPETICDHCGEFYGSFTNYNCDMLGPALGELGDSLIYPELQYEEIELKRPPSNPGEMLGLTLCYEDEDEEGNTEIFIDDIAPSGLAARDGRLRLGDQIIQINGERVRSKALAQELFRSVRGDVSLLVVRPPPASPPGYEEDLDNLLDLPSPGLDTQDAKDRINKNRLSSTSSKDSGHSGGSMDRVSTGSSGSRGSSASSAGPASQPGVKEEQQQSATILTGQNGLLTRLASPFSSAPHSLSQIKAPPPGAGDNCIYSTDTEFYYVDGKLREIDEFYREVRSAECRVKRTERTEDHCVPAPDPVYEIIPEASDGDETLYCLPQDSRPVTRDKTQRTKSPHEKLKSICRSISSPMKMNEFLHQGQLGKVKRSMSNYRPAAGLPAGDCSAGLQSGTWAWGQQQCGPGDGPKLQHSVSNNNNISHISKPGPSSAGSSLRLHPAANSQGSSLTLVNSGGQAKDKHNPEIVYTNINNLERTIRAQQERLLASRQPQFRAPPPPQHPPPGPEHEASTSFMTGEQRDQDLHWEWRIKVRPDGSRYIARRPTRTFLLRQRERQIAEERTGELTTDNEDAASEVKVGKFWTKEQRRKHVEDGKERRRRQEELIKAKNLTKTSNKVTNINNNNNNSPKRPQSYHEPSGGGNNYGNSSEIVLTVATV